EMGLIVGQRRLEAAKRLGLTEIPVRVVARFDDARLALLAERDENLCRLDMAPSERVSLGKALEAMEKEEAKQRQALAAPQEGRGRPEGGPGKEADRSRKIAGTGPGRRPR